MSLRGVYVGAGASMIGVVMSKLRGKCRGCDEKVT